MGRDWNLWGGEEPEVRLPLVAGALIRECETVHRGREHRRNKAEKTHNNLGKTGHQAIPEAESNGVEIGRAHV